VIELAGRDCFDYISITISTLSVIAGSIAAWFAWNTLQRDRWQLEIDFCQVDVERFGNGSSRITYRFKVKNRGYRAVRVSGAFIIVGGQEIPLGQPNNNTKIDCGDEEKFNYVRDRWITIDDVFIIDHDQKRWTIDQKLLREKMNKEKERHQL
jgi:hypothetical protein